VDEVVGVIVEQIARRARAAAAQRAAAGATQKSAPGTPPAPGRAPSPARPAAPRPPATPAAPVRPSPAAAPFDGGLTALPALDAADPFGGVGSALPAPVPDVADAEAATLLSAFSGATPLIAAFVFAEALAPPVALRGVHNLSDSRGV